jgi:hypothetical protein
MKSEFLISSKFFVLIPLKFHIFTSMKCINYLQTFELVSTMEIQKTLDCSCRIKFCEVVSTICDNSFIFLLKNVNNCM